MIRNLLKYRLVCYLIVACFITVLDFVTTISLKYLGLNLIIANTVGMMSGSATQFILLYKYVYKLPLIKNEFFKFESTFLFGLTLSNGIIWTSYKLFELSVYESKSIAIIITFAVLYVIRDWMVTRVVRT